MAEQLTFLCWRCSEQLIDIPMPLSRSEACSFCQADLHVCRQCSFYDTSKASHCGEPIADHVTDKTRANFCGYLSINTAITKESTDHRQNESALNELFGLAGDANETSPQNSSEALSALDELFGLDKKAGD